MVATISAKALTYRLCIVFAVLLLGVNISAAQDRGPDDILSIDWSPNGDLIAVGRGPAVCDPDDTAAYAIRIINAHDGSEVARLQGHHCYVSSLAWSPQGDRLVSGSADGSSIVWDVVSRQPISVETLLPGHRVSLSWNTEGTRYVGITYINGEVFIWDAVSGEAIQVSQDLVLDGNLRDRITAVSWSGDGTRIATAGSGYFNIWDAQNLTLIDRVEGDLSRIFAIAWNTDGSLLATGDEAGNVVIWNEEWDPIARWENDAPIGDVKWNPINNQLAVGTLGRVVVLDGTSGQVIGELDYPGIVIDLAWNPAGAQLAYGGIIDSPQSNDLYTDFAPGIIPPIADASQDQFKVDNDADGIESLVLDASASSDPDGAIVSYEWREGGALIASGVNPTVELAVGVHTLTLTVTDDDGASASDEVVITVRAPSATPAAIDTPQP